MSAPFLSAVLIAKNEEAHIADCLRDAAFCDEAVVVDSGSVDRTSLLAKEAGASVHMRAFDDFASQKNFAISKAAGEWVLLLDADERLSRPLQDEIVQAARSGTFEAYWIRRRNRIFGRWMEHGDHAGDWQLRLIRREQAHFEGRIHERVRFAGPTGRLKHRMDHYSTPDIRTYMSKLRHYTDLDVLESPRAGDLSARGILASAVASLVKRLLLRSAWRDGVQGILFAVLSAYYDIVRKVKLWESIHV